MTTKAEEPNFSETRAELFESISHPARIEILQALNEKPMGFTVLGRAVGIEGGGQLAFHLRKLGRLVEVTSDGIYALTGEGREALRSVNAVRKSHKGLGNKGETAGAHGKRTTKLLASTFAKQRSMKSRVTIIALFVLLLLGGTLLIPRVVGQTSSASVFGSLSVDHSVLNGNSTSAELPSGSRIYLWAFDSGGFRDSSDLSVGAKDNFYTGFALGGEVGESTSNRVNFSTNAFLHSIGGVGVSGFGNETFRSVKTNPRVYSVGITVTPTSPSLVVIIALQAGDGPVGRFSFNGSTDVTTDQGIYDGNGGSQPMVIAHAFLLPATYLFTSSIQNTTSDASYASMIAVWLFTPASTAVSSAPTLIGLPYWELVTVVVVLAIAVAAGVFALRRAKKPSPK